MGPYHPAVDDIYRRYADLLLRHHYLLSDCMDKDSEIETVEEEMTQLWDRLDETQRHSLSGLGSDLNWFRRGCQLAPRSRRPEKVTHHDFQALVKARESSDWHGLLHYLRLCAPKATLFQLAYVRATAWASLEIPQVASVFYDVAAKSEPSNGSIAFLALRTADQTDARAALERAQRIVDDPFRHPAIVVAFAVSLLLLEAEKRGNSIDRQRFTDWFRDCLAQIHLEPPSDDERAMTYQLAAFGFVSLDELPDAMHCFEQGLRLAPNSDALWTGLGLLLYGREDERAADAFEHAARLSSPVVWPYFFLAHYHLSHGRFEQALTYCSQAWQRVTTNPVRAELLEWTAICQGELSYPDESVRALFQRAESLDPTNERIARNLVAFENARRTAAQLEFDFEPANSLKVRRAREARPSPHSIAA